MAEPVRINDVEAEKETDKALLCLIGGQAICVPKTVIHDDSEVYQEGDIGTLVIQEWWARDRGLD